MDADVTRRDVLKATTAAGITVGLAGCTSSLPLVGDSGPCSDAESFFTDALAGDTESALEYIPYEYYPATDREEALEEFDWSNEFNSEIFEDFDIDFSCECAQALDDEIDGIDEAGADLDGHEITAAEELRWVITTSMEVFGQDIGDEKEEGAGLMVEIDSDGWYFWESQQTSEKC